MPIRIRLDRQLQILFTTAQGVVTLENIRCHLDEEIRAGGIAYRELFDATAAQTNLTADEARSLVGRLTAMVRTQILGPTAVITVNDVFYGMARMIEILSELHNGPRIRVFRSYDEGLGWLLRIENT